MRLPGQAANLGDPPREFSAPRARRNSELSGAIESQLLFGPPELPSRAPQPTRALSHPSWLSAHPHGPLCPGAGSPLLSFPAQGPAGSLPHGGVASVLSSFPPRGWRVESLWLLCTPDCSPVLPWARECSTSVGPVSRLCFTLSRPAVTPATWTAKSVFLMSSVGILGPDPTCFSSSLPSSAQVPKPGSAGVSCGAL